MGAGHGAIEDCEVIEECPHGRHIGAVCIPCAHEEYGEKLDGVTFSGLFERGSSQFGNEHTQPRYEREATGLDAPYYDIPENVRCVQDAIEYLGLNFAQGNILKSLWREHGTTTKGTDPLYEAEKRYYFAKRELDRVRANNEMEQKGKRARRDVEVMREGVPGTHDESDAAKGGKST